MLQIIQFHQTFGREEYDEFENKQCVIKRNEVDFTVDLKIERKLSTLAPKYCKYYSAQQERVLKSKT